VLKKY